MDRETVVSKEKRDRDQNVVQSLRDRRNLHKFLDRKAEFAVQGELTQQRLHEAEADVGSNIGDRRINGLIRLKERR